MIGLVLDATAMVEYARGSDAVGELLILAQEDARFVGLPAAALVQAFADAPNGDHAMLRLLAAGPGAVVVSLGVDEAHQVGVLSRRTGVATAHAVKTTIETGAYLVTAQPKAVEGLIDGKMIVEI